MYVEVLTCTCHNPMCLGFLRNGHIDESGRKRIVSCSGINKAAWMWPVIGADIYHVCNYWNLVNAAQSWSGPRNLAARCKTENLRHLVTFDNESTRDVSRRVNNQSVYNILSVGNKQNVATENWMMIHIRWGSDRVQQESGPISLFFFVPCDTSVCSHYIPNIHAPPCFHYSCA